MRWWWGKDTWGITGLYFCSPVSCTTCACYYKSSLWIINHNREEPFHIVLFLYVRNVLVLWIYQCNVSGVAEQKLIDTWSSFPYCVPFRVFLVKLTDWRANEALEERRLSDWRLLWLMVPMDNTTWNSHQKLRTVSRQVKVRIWGLPLHDRCLPPHFPIRNSNRLDPSAWVISDCWTLCIIIDYWLLRNRTCHRHRLFLCW